MGTLKMLERNANYVLSRFHCLTFTYSSFVCCALSLLHLVCVWFWVGSHCAYTFCHYLNTYMFLSNAYGVC
jgi:hypothetical protein